ncbi:hypothetical protein FRX31_010387 [Thalictrum thalictroides]|uniref:Uncharacterized protein n=1 Tax=Thalictrum thalictroides TaxID=46969 RepID=A0A7J6WVB4_THATH|nr:hypothetical protein FRX31_010387 [Thalictrum thalictroides]
MPRGVSLHSNHKATCIFARPHGRCNSDGIPKQIMSILGDSNIEDFIKLIKEAEETVIPKL